MPSLKHPCEAGVACDSDRPAEYRWQGRNLCSHHFSYNSDSCGAVSARAEFKRKSRKGEL